MKTKTTHTDKKDIKRTHTNWSDNSKHSLWLIRRKKLQIVVSLGELFLFVAYWTQIPISPPPPQIPIFCWSDPDFSFQLSGRSGYILLRNRFRAILSMLHFSNAGYLPVGHPNHDPLYKIRTMYEHFRRN